MINIIFSLWGLNPTSNGGVLYELCGCSNMNLHSELYSLLPWQYRAVNFVTVPLTIESFLPENSDYMWMHDITTLKKALSLLKGIGWEYRAESIIIYGWTQLYSQPIPFYKEDFWIILWCKWGTIATLILIDSSDPRFQFGLISIHGYRGPWS